MYPETDLGVYARGVAPMRCHPLFSTLRCRSILSHLQCRSLLPTQESNTQIHGDASTGKPRHLVPQAHRRKIFVHFHGLSHSSTRATTAYRFVWKHILQVKTCISGASYQTCTHRWNTTVSFYDPTV
nr:gag pol polyprotein [Hymenolepis microstoma]